MRIALMSGRRVIEVRGFKWPDRPTSTAVACILGEDAFGQWLGFARGDQWRTADGKRSGVFETSFVKLVPRGTFWTACFMPVDPIVDVDIVLPVRRVGDALEEVDLELDIVCCGDGSVSIRDREEFVRVQEAYGMPADVRAQAEETCERLYSLVMQGAEPFGDVGRMWLAHFMAEAR